MEVNEVGDEVPQVGATGLGATGLGATGVEAGRVNALEEGKFIKRLIDPRLPIAERRK